MIFVTLLNVALLALFVYLIVLLVKALRRYLKKDTAPAAASHSIGEAIRAHRTACGMTQEYVAQSLGVSRQAVSKWESCASDPSTGNLLALADLFGISPAELLPKKD